jgi:hypothetical protein
MWSRRILPAVAVMALLADGVSAQELPAWREKVDPWVLDTLAHGEKAEFFVFLERQADLSAADSLPSKRAKGRYVFETLSRVASETQGPLLETLSQRGVEHRSFWVANMIWARGDSGLVRELASRREVTRIHANPSVAFDRPEMVPRARSASATAAIEVSIQHTGAPDVFWDAGIDGEGVVIAGADTGYQWDHEALRPHYRGVANGGVDHNYNWHDAIHSSVGSCGSDSPEPCDDDSHGTHTMGTMVGDDGGANRIGMAPGAKWIGCRNMDDGVGTPATYSECFEWFIAPTNLAGGSPDPDRAPDVINNSWSCPPVEGCTDPNMLRTVVENTRKAGIVVVVSAGNEGPGCQTVANPSGIYDASLTVGATNNNDLATEFSSRGPVAVDGSNRLKPDIVAPGFQVRSSVRGGYGQSNGTSMAGPHVAGLVALLISDAECLRGNPKAIENHIFATAEPLTSDQSCGVAGSEIPNNVYGFGAIRAVRADCGAGVGGALTGLAGKKITCRNRGSRPRQKVTSQLAGAEAWSCSEMGMSASGGDRLKIQLTADAVGAGVAGGVVEGIQKPKVVCKNQTGGGKRTLRPEPGEAWDCAAAGLEVAAGDVLKLTVSGKAL